MTAPPSLESEVEAIADAWDRLNDYPRDQCHIELAEQVARLVWARAIEEAAEALDGLKLHPGIVGDHQPSKWRNSALEMGQRNIRALPGPFQGKKEAT